MDENTIKKLEDLIAQHDGPDKEDMKSALEGLQKTIMGQALLIRKQIIKLRSYRIDAADLANLLSEHDLQSIFRNLGTAKKNSFSITEVDNTARDLYDSIQNANNFSDIMANVVQVAKVFI